MLGCDGLVTFAGASWPATATWLKKGMMQLLSYSRFFCGAYIVCCQILRPDITGVAHKTV